MSTGDATVDALIDALRAGLADCPTDHFVALGGATVGGHMVFRARHVAFADRDAFLSRVDDTVVMWPGDDDGGAEIAGRTMRGNVEAIIARDAPDFGPLPWTHRWALIMLPITTSIAKYEVATMVRPAPEEAAPDLWRAP